jgi:hypothetical protein
LTLSATRLGDRVRLEIDVAGEIELALSAVDLALPEVRAQLRGGARSVRAESGEPADGETIRVVITSDVFTEPKVIAVREAE